MLDIDRLIAECRAAVAADQGGTRALREVVARAVADPAAVLAALGEPMKSGIWPLYHGQDVTVINLVWAPNMMIMPHDHHMAAVIGIYTGREDNIFWRRRPDDARRIEAAGARSLCQRDVTVLGRDIIHSVVNPIGRLTGAIHVYAGDFFRVERSEWDPEELSERPYDVAKARQMFAGAA
ncbi:MAG TPA: hypothetical protein VFA03_01705 [Acetobacteraceae bacterium]|nr:hypothetical protein [Acetobacteraceae bacterium]